MMLLWSLLLSSLVVAEAPQTVTNGVSTLGTFDVPTFHPCLGDQSPDSLCNKLVTWIGDKIEDLLNEIRPSRERRYTFEVTRGFLSPDGVNSSMILVNGGFPGPTIEADIGDTFVIQVRNNIQGPAAGTALHWHGLFQKQSPFMDGVPSISMCPIAPGQSFTYRFKAERAGTSWWHSHTAGQTLGGLYGAMIIHGKPAFKYDVDVSPVILSDWWHRDYTEIIDKTMDGDIEATLADNNLINGKGNFDCSKTTNGQQCIPNAGVSKFKFRSGKTHLLRLINAGSDALEHFTIDVHRMTIVSQDYTPIQPYETDVVTLSPGQRADVLVKGVGNPDSSFWMRSDVDNLCGIGNRTPNARAAIYYEKANRNIEPTTSATTCSRTGCGAEPIAQIKPLIPQKPTQSSFTQPLEFDFRPNSTGTVLFFANGNSFRTDYNRAILSDATHREYPLAGAPPAANIYDYASNSSIRILMRNNFIGPHPMHLHGHDFRVLAEGYGDWDGKIVNSGNPIRRDTHQMLPGPYAPDAPSSYLAIEVALDNPGVWPLHCHLVQHLGLGMAINIAYRKDAIEKLKPSREIKEVCRSWNEYASKNHIDQPDSGLRRYS